jgi:hypothetical protein
VSDPEPESERPRLLPRREPRPLVVHFLVDAGIAFLALVLLFLILALSIRVTVAVSLALGIVAAPFSRRAEARALAQRPAGDPRG